MTGLLHEGSLTVPSFKMKWFDERKVDSEMGIDSPPPHADGKSVGVSLSTEQFWSLTAKQDCSSSWGLVLKRIMAPCSFSSAIHVSGCPEIPNENMLDPFFFKAKIFLVAAKQKALAIQYHFEFLGFQRLGLDWTNWSQFFPFFSCFLTSPFSVVQENSVLL